MEERHEIYRRRASGAPPPWTTDDILGKYKFTNVYRELDRVTIWVRENIREPFADHPTLWFMLAIARQINWPETLQELLQDKRGAWPSARRWSPERARAIMLARQARGEQLYTGAYILNAQFGKARPANVVKMDKAYFTCHLCLAPIWEDRRKVEPELHDTLERAHAAFLPYHGWGGFTAYEVVSDLRWTRYLQDAPDKCSWAYAGPGAKRGLNRLYNRPLREGIPSIRMQAELQAAYLWLYARWHYEPRLEMREVEHSLCEFDKYERALKGEGRPRSLYRGGYDAPNICEKC